MPTNLPADRTRLVGRAHEIALASAAEERVVSLLGPPGVGKSRLAAHLARTWAHPSWWIDATGLGTAASLRAAVAAVLGLTAGGEVARALAGRGALGLVIDGAEHLRADARDEIGAWIDAAPRLRVLVTTIGRLGIVGERVIELSPLPLADAVALFADRAAAAGAEPEDPRDVEPLVEQLDRLPLAIELAAARATVLTARQLLQRVQGGHRLPDGGRHGSLQAAIAFAWDLLDPGEQQALAWCSVFRGGFDVDAAEGVLEGPDVLGRLAGLRDRSMLQRHGDRFTLLESVRAHAAARLDASGQRSAAEARHAAWYRVAGERRAAATSTGEDAEALRWLTAERDNLLAAFERSRGDEAAALALVLHLVLSLRGPLDRAGEVLDAALTGVVDRTLRVRLLRVRADVHARAGRPDRARGALDLALGSLGGVPDAVRAQVLTDSGRLRAPAGDTEAARAELIEAIECFRRGGMAFQEGFARNSLGVVEEVAGDARAAAAAFEEALGLFREAGSTRMEGIATLNLGVMRSAEGRLDAALDLLERARDRLRESGSSADEVGAHVNLGHIHLTAGRLDAAEEALRTGLALERAVGKRDFEALALGNLGLVAAERGEWRAARASLQAGLEQLTHQRRTHARFLAFLAAVEVALGHADEARRAFATAREGLDGDPGGAAALRVLEGFLDLSGPGAPDERVRAASARLRDDPGDDLAVARRLLERAIAGFAGGEASPAPAAVVPSGALVVGPEAVWFEVDGARVDLARRGPLRRVLLAIADQRLLAPGTGLPVDRLFAAGWPGDRALPSAASNRVYTTINALRSLGLDRVLQRRDDGYLLDPEVPLLRAH